MWPLPYFRGMRPIHLLFPILFFSCATTAPDQETVIISEPEPRTLPEATRERGLRIQPVHHSAIVIEGNEGVIYVDPHTGAVDYRDLAAPNLILITDIHEDHLDIATLQGLNLENALIIAPPAVEAQLPDDLKRITKPMQNGARTELNGIVVEAIPMYNISTTAEPHHPKGRGNGYVVKLSDKRIYISGDTEDIIEMRSLKDIDIAFVCMNEPYTMSVKQAASAVLDFKPKVVYPYHYRGKQGLSDIREFKEIVSAEDPDIEVRLVQWY
jgi:L-ascorbate metabolism protein UlaG (beta-lactamase superfamily)